MSFFSSVYTNIP